MSAQNLVISLSPPLVLRSHHHFSPGFSKYVKQGTKTEDRPCLAFALPSAFCLLGLNCVQLVLRCCSCRGTNQARHKICSRDRQPRICHILNPDSKLASGRCTVLLRGVVLYVPEQRAQDKQAGSSSPSGMATSIRIAGAVPLPPVLEVH
jgi:hypothetical protein